MRAARVRSGGGGMRGPCSRGGIMLVPPVGRTRSASLFRSRLVLPPLVDALDDVETLVRPDVAECARLACKRCKRIRGAEPVLEPRLLGAQLLHDLLALSELALGIDVPLDRAVIEQRVEDERAPHKPAADDARPRGAATLPGHRTRLRPPRARPFQTP